METITMIKYLGLLMATYVTMKHLIIRRFKNLPPSPPFCLPIIGHLYLLYNPIHQALARIAVQYGPVLYLRFGARPVLLVSSPDVVEECLIKKDVFQDRPALLPTRHQMFNYLSIPWSPQGPHWRNLRKIAAVEILSPQQMQILSGVRAEVARTFIRRMMKEIIPKNGNGEAIVEMKSVIFGLTLDNMTRMLVGRSNYEEGLSKTTSEALAKFQEMVEESFRVSGVGSSVDDFLPLVRWFRAVFARKALTEAEETMVKMNENKERFMLGLMEEHRQMDKEGKLSDAQLKSMLQVLLLSQKKDPEHYHDRMIGSLLLTLFQGGTDTSASTVVWTLSLLLNNPHLLKKAQAEMDRVVGFERLVEESDKNNLPYIQAIVNETFRICPTGPLALPYVARVDCEVAGYHVPKGTMLIYNIWAIHNEPKIWAEPRTFDPDRFVGLPNGKRFGCEFMPFGTGKRICPGEHLATRVVWLSVATLIQCFDWERASHDLVDMKEGGGVTLAKVDPLFVKCCPRPCMINLLSSQFIN